MGVTGEGGGGHGGHGGDSEIMIIKRVEKV